MAETATPFVGRQAELEQLRQIYRATMSARKPRFVLIQGDFGVGKTTLIERFLSEVAAYQPPALVGRGKCAIETTLSGLIPFSQLFATLTEQGVQRRVVLGNLADFAKEVAPAWLDIFTGGVAGAVMKTVEQSGKLLGNQPAFTQQNVYVQFTNALGKLAEKQPVVAFIDDLHWADSSSLGLLFHLACYLQDRSVLFLCTYRPVEAMETGTHANLFRDIRANLIRYGALDVEIKAGIEAAAYAAQRYPSHSFPDSFLNQIQELTDGHPLFVSQLFSMWQDRGLITLCPGPAGSLSWGLSGEVETSVVMPQTLSEVLQERMRLVEERLRDILSYASVAGEEFPAQVIIRLLQLDEAKAFDDFDVLANRYRFIRELRTEELPNGVLDIYQFAHRFFREHIYGLLSGGKRRVLHRQVGECLEALYAGGSEKARDKIAGQLAIHFREARDSLRAARFALQAARFEGSRYAWDEAERWCELGLSALERMEENPERDPLRLDLRVQSGRGQLLAGRYAAAGERYDAALQLAQTLGVEATRLAELCERLADIAEYRNQYDEMRGYLEQGHANLDLWAVPFGEIHVKLAALEGVMQGRLGNNEQSIAALRQVLTDAEGLPQTPELQSVKARVHNALGIALENISDYVGAANAYRQAIQLENKLGAKWQSTINMLNLAYLSIELGQGAAAAGLVNQGLKAAQEMGSLDTLAYAHSLLGRTHLGAGRAAEASKSLNEAIRLSEQCGALWNLPVMRADLALAHLALGKFALAREQAGLALAEAEKAQQPFESGLACDALGRIEAAEGRLSEAAARFQQAVALQEQGGNRHYQALARVHWAETLIAQGERVRANELLAEAVSAFNALKLPQEAARAQKLMA